MQQDNLSNGQLNWANSTSNIDLEQQSKPKYWQTSSKFTYPYREEELPMETWTVQTDGSATKKVGGAGVVLVSREREILKYAVRLQF